MKAKLFGLAVLCVMSTVVTSGANASMYNFETIQNPYAPGYTVLTGINDNSEIVGQYVPGYNGCACNSIQSFTYKSGRYTAISGIGTYTYANEINSSGRIAGSFANGNQNKRTGFVYFRLNIQR